VTLSSSSSSSRWASPHQHRGERVGGGERFALPCGSGEGGRGRESESETPKSVQEIVARRGGKEARSTKMTREEEKIPSEMEKRGR
jgi:hypothetical protein